MNIRARFVLTSAAVAALAFSAGAQARDLIWDSDGASGALGTDGSGNWDLTSPNWVDGDLTTGTNVVWTNTPGDNAVFGTSTVAPTTVAPYDVDLAAPITVQNITLGTAANGASYNISDIGGGSLTVNGNITKSSAGGALQFFLISGPLTLSAGDHTFAINDTSGDVPELSMNGEITGPGNIVMDNGSYITYGTMVFNIDNSYTGTTTINKGRLIVTTSGALGPSSGGGVFIGPLGTLSIGGAGTTFSNGLNISKAITINRDTYSGGDYGIYPAAVIVNNNGQSQPHTLSGQITINSNDARISVNTNTLIIPGGNIVLGPNGANGVLSFTGDYSGFVQLQGSNPALATNGIKLVNAVEVQISSDDAIGGPTAPIQFTGDATLGIMNPAMTSFGAHPINTSSFSGGLDIPTGGTFTIDRTITGGSGIGKRGGGSLSFTSPVTATGSVFWDAGTVNINSAVTLASIHLRSPVVNIGTGGTLNTTGGYDSLGQDSNGTNGGPDIATVNLTGTGAFIENSGDDFNLSDNANTQGTINMYDNSVLTTGGVTYLAKGNGTSATINQHGGTITINRNGNFGFVIADGRGGHSPTGAYNLSGGTFTSAGEVYVGEGGNGAHATWTQTGGTANINNWFVVGREGAVGNVDISGGTMNHAGGNMSLGDSDNGGVTETINVHGTAVINDTVGELWVGNNGNAIAVMNVADTASVAVNDWLAVGRGGGTGTLNITSGTVTQQSKNWFTIGSGGTGTVNISGGTLNALQAYIGQNGGGTGTLNINGGSVTFTNNSIFANADSINGNLNLNVGTLTAFGFTAQNGGGTGKGTFTFNGGVLRAGADNTNFIGAKVTSVVSTGGAKIDTNSHSVTVGSAFTHDTTLGGADGGLTKTGAGNLTLNGANTYTGKTILNGSGSVVLGASAWSPVLTGGGAVINSSKLVFNYASTTTPVTTIASLLKTSHDSSNFRDSTQRLYTTNAADANHSLGYFDNGTSVTVAYTWTGDANVDGRINGDDYALIDRGYAKGLTGWSNGDFNYDGVVNASDYMMIDTSFGIESPGGLSPSFLASREEEFGQAYVTQLVAAVPEPATLGLLVGMSAVGLGRRRNRR